MIFLAAFGAGIISFLSPCVLPLVPGFLAYMSGTSIAENNVKVFSHSIAYVLGFSVVFSLLGVLLNTVLASVSYSVQTWLSRLGGTIIIFFGLYTIGLIRPAFLEREHKFDVKINVSYLTSFLFGASFAVGWTPCVGAVLGSVFALAITNPQASFALLFAYSLGLGLPFLAVGLFSKQALEIIRRMSPHMKYFNIIVGILLIILGILVFTQTVILIANLGIINEVLL